MALRVFVDNAFVPNNAFSGRSHAYRATATDTLQLGTCACVTTMAEALKWNSHEYFNQVTTLYDSSIAEEGSSATPATLASPVRRSR